MDVNGQQRQPTNSNDNNNDNNDNNDNNSWQQQSMTATTTTTVPYNYNNTSANMDNNNYNKIIVIERALFRIAHTPRWTVGSGMGGTGAGATFPTLGTLKLNCKLNIKVVQGRNSETSS